MPLASPRGQRDAKPVSGATAVGCDARAATMQPLLTEGPGRSTSPSPGSTRSPVRGRGRGRRDDVRARAQRHGGLEMPVRAGHGADHQRSCRWTPPTSPAEITTVLPARGRATDHDLAPGGTRRRRDRQGSGRRVPDVAVGHDGGLVNPPSDPLPRSVTSRRYCAWAQISGEAEPAGLPFVKPMDAVAGSEPYGDAATAGSSQACSGTIPSPEVMSCMACSREPGRTNRSADPARRARRRVSATGARTPGGGEPRGPVGEQSVGSGT